MSFPIIVKSEFLIVNLPCQTGKGLSKKKTQITFNLTYYSVFKNVMKILERLRLLLTPDQAHKKIFSEAPIIDFKHAKSLKDHLVRAVLSQLDKGQI